MVSDDEKQDTLKRILGSKAFSKSTTANVLLKFLVKSSIDGKEISASDISHEIFGTQYQHEKSEANVRVNVYHLRKKLTKYFEVEGADIPIHISIERGQYGVSYIRNDRFYEIEESANKRTLPKVNYPLLVGSILFSLAMGIITYLYLRSEENVWKSIFESERETHFFLGNLFIYDGITQFEGTGFHRDHNINSTDDFYTKSKQNPEKFKHLSPTQYAVVSYENAAILKDFGIYFGKNDASFSVRNVSNFDMKDVKDMNLIYAGHFLTDPPFIELFNQRSKNFKLIKIPYRNDSTKYRWSLKAQKNDSIVYFRSDGRNFEHALVASFRGANNTSYRMFFSDHGLGLTAIAEYFTQPDSLLSFSERYLQKSDEFIALFFVRGHDRTNFDLKLELIDGNL